MFARLAEASTSLDIGTLVRHRDLRDLAARPVLVVRLDAGPDQGAGMVGLGLSDRRTLRRALASRRAVSPPLPSGIAVALLFIAVGMIWSAARLFHGRPVRWGAMCFGAVCLGRAPGCRRLPGSAGRRIMSQFDHRRHLYLHDRRRTVARTAQVADAPLAGAVRADAARRHLSVSCGAGEPRRP